VPTLNDVLAGSQAQAVQVQQIIDALKGTPNKGVPVALVSLNDPNNYALTVQNDDPVNSRALSVLKADGTTLISADATGVTLGSPVNVPPGSISGTAIAAGSITNSMLGADVARDNLLCSGSFEIWQRGNGPFSASGATTSDRWTTQIVVTDTLSVSRDTANADGAGADAACTFVLGTGAGATRLYQLLRVAGEHSNLPGKTLTASIRIRVAVANAVRVGLWSDGASGTNVYSGFHTGSGAYQTLTVTYAVPTDATQVILSIWFAASCTAYLDNAMLVVGSQAANYVPMHPADDLARCLRYYEALVGGTTNEFVGTAACVSTTTAYTSKTMRVVKAVTPTMTISVGAVWTALSATGVGLGASLAASAFNTGTTGLIATAASGLVAGNASLIQATAGAVVVAESNP
jgi:hypothetical protein